MSLFCPALQNPCEEIKCQCLKASTWWSSWTAVLQGQRSNKWPREVKEYNNHQLSHDWNLYNEEPGFASLHRCWTWFDALLSSVAFSQSAKISLKTGSTGKRHVRKYLQWFQDSLTWVQELVITRDKILLKSYIALRFTCIKLCEVGSSALREGTVLCLLWIYFDLGFVLFFSYSLLS